MDYDFVFVHGTGVREPSYSKTFNIIKTHLNKYKGNRSIQIHQCYWGGSCGSKMKANGQSIPVKRQTKAMGAELSEEQLTLELWRLLYQDPLFELKFLALQNRKTQDSYILGEEECEQRKEHLRQTLKKDFCDFDDPAIENLKLILDEVGLTPEKLNDARNEIIEDLDYQAALQSVQEPLEEYRQVLARALVAKAVILTQKQEGELALFLDAKHLDLIVATISSYLGNDQEKGLGDWVENSLKELLFGIGTRWLLSRRDDLSKIVSPGAGDVFMYQARGEKIRNHIINILNSLSNNNIVLIAHSLGGIACVDLLLLNPDIRSRVKLLVTVGSQAPALYELNALVSQHYDSVFVLPTNFPQWLNIYDENDFGSYVGEKIFGKDFVKDVEVCSNQPFPLSHGAYWVQEITWKAIFDKLT